MKVVLSDEVHKDIEKLYDRRIYLTDKSFCQSFVSYCNKMANDFNEKYNLKISQKVDCSKFKKTKNAPKLSWFLVQMFV